MGEEYTQRAGYPPGFDGRCWPKDLAALIAASTDAGYDPRFLRSISDANDRFRFRAGAGLRITVDKWLH
jgi:UDP-glucose 6-dehydrogenase